MAKKTISSLAIIWFTPNPTTYGSASRSFEVQCSGGEKSFEDQQLFPVSNELSSEFIFQVRYDRIE